VRSSAVVVMFALAVAAVGAAGCQEEPSLLCDRARVVWPFFDIDPRLDTSPDDGLQIDLELRSSLLPGTSVFLTVQGEEGDPVAHPQPAVADEDGDVLFTDVNVPFGRVTFEVNAHNECGDVRSLRTPYVWDGLGFPRCDLDLGVEPAVVDDLAPLSVLRAEHDGDPDQPGVQLQVSIDAGRPDMTVTLFALDPATGEQQIFEEESGDDLRASFPVTLGEGEHALRAVCVWEPAGLRPSSRTARLLVDTVAPDCELVDPAARVTAADDLDPGIDGVQIALRGRSTAPDVAGEAATFAVQGELIDGSAVDDAGESSAATTIVLDPPGAPQELVFALSDHAGNLCEDAVTF